MRFAYPILLLLILLIPLLVWLKHFMQRKQSMQFSSGSVLRDLPKSWRIRLQPLVPVTYAFLASTCTARAIGIGCQCRPRYWRCP